ncbi:hypothetical protein D3C81_2204190 [compost metagenome]
MMAVIHAFGGDVPEAIRLPLPAFGRYEITQVFSDGTAEVTLEDGNIACRLNQPFSAVCLLLTKMQSDVQ